MLINASVIALEMPARDQPVSIDIGCRKTASAKIVPTATQVIKAPAATRPQGSWGRSAARAEATAALVELLMPNLHVEWSHSMVDRHALFSTVGNGGRQPSATEARTPL